MMGQKKYYQSAIAKLLLQIKAIKLNTENPFIWSSGIESPIYCDNRLVLSDVQGRELVAEGLEEVSRQFLPFEQIAGVATAGIAHGILLAQRLELPFLYVRSKAKEHGRKNQIEGKLFSDAKILVVEDLISTGGSALKAVDALREAGANVQGVVAIFTYGFEKAVKAFDAASCPFATILDYDILIEEALKEKYIQPKDLNFLKEWRSNI